MTIAKDITKVLSTRSTVRLAVLFGSLSRGPGQVESDLDIAVAGRQPLTAGEKMGLMEALAQVTGRPIDLVDLQSAGGPILSQALTTGKLIYCVDHGLYGELIKKMLFERADMEPYRQRILAERRKTWIGA